MISEQYALGADFGIGDFVNWVPAHANGNARQSATLFPDSPALLAAWNRSVDAPAAREIAERTRAHRRKGDVLGKLDVALHAGEVTREDIETLIEGLPVAPAGEHRGRGERTLRFNERWAVVGNIRALEYVTDGSMFGFRPPLDGAEPHDSFSLRALRELRTMERHNLPLVRHPR